MAEVPVQASLRKNVDFLQRAPGRGESFDLLVREIQGRGARMLPSSLLTALPRTMSWCGLCSPCCGVEREQIAVRSYEKLLKHFLPYIEVAVIQSLEEAMTKILSGALVLFIDGEKSEAIEIDARSTPARSPPRNPTWKG